jgi:hypothetical protein
MVRHAGGGLPAGRSYALTTGKDIHKQQYANFASPMHPWIADKNGDDARLAQELRKTRFRFQCPAGLGQASRRGEPCERSFAAGELSTVCPRLRSPPFWLRVKNQQADVEGTLTEKRLSLPVTAGPNAAPDEHFNRVFTELQKMIKALELDAERRVVGDYAESKRIFYGINFAWLLIVVAATAGLGSLAARKERAEIALQSKDELPESRSGRNWKRQ